MVIHSSFTAIYIVSLRTYDTYGQHGSGLILAQVMVCCLTAPSHYLTQYWHLINKVIWHSPEHISQMPQMLFCITKNNHFKIIATSSRDQTHLTKGPKLYVKSFRAVSTVVQPDISIGKCRSSFCLSGVRATTRFPGHFSLNCPYSVSGKHMQLNNKKRNEMLVHVS